MAKDKKTRGPGRGRKSGTGPTKNLSNRDTSGGKCGECDHDMDLHDSNAGCQAIVGGKFCGCFG